MFIDVNEHWRISFKNKKLPNTHETEDHQMICPKGGTEIEKLHIKFTIIKLQRFP